MATILEFPASQSRASSHAHTMSGLSCQVVIFPGVRYERTDDTTTAKPKRRPSRRDHLEFED